MSVIDDKFNKSDKSLSVSDNDNNSIVVMDVEEKKDESIVNSFNKLNVENMIMDDETEFNLYNSFVLNKSKTKSYTITSNNLISIDINSSNDKEENMDNNSYHAILNRIFNIKYIMKKYNKHMKSARNHENITPKPRMPFFSYDFTTFCKKFHNIKSEVELLETLIHLKLYLEHIKHIILDWEEMNKREYNEDVYIKMCNYSKEINDIIEDSNYYNLLNCVIKYIYWNNIDELEKTDYYDDSVKQIIDEKGDKFLGMEDIKVKIYEHHFDIVNKIWSNINI